MWIRWGQIIVKFIICELLFLALVVNIYDANISHYTVLEGKTCKSGGAIYLSRKNNNERQREFITGTTSHNRYERIFFQ